MEFPYPYTSSYNAEDPFLFGSLSANINFKCIHCHLVHHVCMVAIDVDVTVETKKEFDVIRNANLGL